MANNSWELILSDRVILNCIILIMFSDPTSGPRRQSGFGTAAIISIVVAILIVVATVVGTVVGKLLLRKCRLLAKSFPGKGV